MSNRQRPRLRACAECSNWRPVDWFAPDVDVCGKCLGRPAETMPPGRPGCRSVDPEPNRLIVACPEGSCELCAFIDDVEITDCCAEDTGELCPPGRCEGCDVEWFASPLTPEDAETVEWARGLRAARVNRLDAWQAAGFDVPEDVRR